MLPNSSVPHLCVPAYQPNQSPIIFGLGIIMRNNVFCFDDTRWLQRTSTAMTTPPGTSYATLYLGIYMNFRSTRASARHCRFANDILMVTLPYGFQTTSHPTLKPFVSLTNLGALENSIGKLLIELVRSIFWISLSQSTLVASRPVRTRIPKTSTCTFHPTRHIHQVYYLDLSLVLLLELSDSLLRGKTVKGKFTHSFGDSVLVVTNLTNYDHYSTTRLRKQVTPVPSSRIPATTRNGYFST